jgi:hypothetical protein
LEHDPGDKGLGDTAYAEAVVDADRDLADQVAVSSGSRPDKAAACADGDGEAGMPMTVDWARAFRSNLSS